jgi:hypothetical protein
MKIELSEQEWQLVINVLARAPYSEVAQVIANIARQAGEARQAPPS